MIFQNPLFSLVLFRVPSWHPLLLVGVLPLVLVLLLILWIPFGTFSVHFSSALTDGFLSLGKQSKVCSRVPCLFRN